MKPTAGAGALLLLAAPSLALAHDGRHEPSAAAGAWFWDALVVALLLLSVSLYARGLRRLWRSAGAGHGVSLARAVAFGAGLACIALALLSPLDRASDVLFSAHMAQHELLTLVAAPLLVLGLPQVTAAWAVPLAWRRRTRAALRSPRLLGAWRLLTRPLVALVLHGAVLWLWHLPALFEAALASEAIHAVQHASFLATAVLFWWSLLAGRYGRLGYGAAVLFVFLTAVHSGTLGALITVARGAWYPTHEARTLAGGMDPLADQQMAGLLMWIPGGVLLLTAALALFAAWLGALERRGRRTSPAAPRLEPEGE